MKYYLYRHIRLDKNVPFYIGIGKKENSFASYETEYSRAFSKRSRNKHWYGITNKTDYQIEILFESDCEIEIKKKEKELIKLYGRRDLKTGTLCNLTDGGDGIINLSYEARKKISESQTGAKNYMFGKTHTTEARVKMSKARIGKDSWMKGKKHTDESNEKNRIAQIRKPVIALRKADETFEQKFTSIKEAAKILNIFPSHISSCCKNKEKSANGFIFKYAA